MSEPEVVTGEILVPAEEFNVVEVTEDAQPDLTVSSGQRFALGLQHQFSGHKIMGSDGLSEIVTMQMSRVQADAFQEILVDKLAALRDRQSAKAATLKAVPSKG